MLQPGTKLGDNHRYVITRHIGNGGMGTVFRARDTRLNRDVAIKMMMVTPTEEATRAFRYEAEILAKLRHPALPAVSDYFEDQAHHQYLVMDYIEGEDLSQKLRERPQPFDVSVVMRWSEILLDALVYLHSQPEAIIHRDIKPQNIKLTPYGQLMLLDFGLAKIAPPDASGYSTPGYSRAYSAYEQINGQGTDSRADQFALAATLYHLLAGKPPADSPSRMRAIVQTGKDSLVPLDMLNPKVPKRLAQILARSLELEKEKRFPSVQVLRSSLNTAWVQTQRGPIGPVPPTISVAEPNEPPPVEDEPILTPITEQGRSEPERPQYRPPGRMQRLLSRHLALWFVSLLALVAVLLDVVLLMPNIQPTVIGQLGFQPTDLSIIAVLLAVFCMLVLWLDATFGSGGRPAVRLLRNHTNEVKSVTFAPDSWQLASASSDGKVNVWQVDPLKNLFACDSYRGEVREVRYLPDSSHFVSAGSDGVVRLWRARDGARVQEMPGHTGGVRSIAASPDGEFIASAGEDATVRLWNVSDGREIQTLRGHKGQLWKVVYSRDGKLLASAGEDGSIRIWRVMDGHPVGVLIGHGGAVYDICFNPAGSTLASCGEDKTVRLWNVSKAEQIHVMVGHQESVGGVAFAPNGHTLASRSADGTVRMWRARDGKCLRVLKDSMGYVSAMKFSHDGKVLATGSWDGIARVWQADDARQPRRIRSHTAPIRDIALSWDGRWLATASTDQTVRLIRMS